MDNGNRLLILSILEGRHFPLRQSVNIVIDAKFDGESLSSDPVAHVSNPSFSVELGWLIEKRALHDLHVKRSPLKLQAYAINSKTGSKESIGYIILDTRQAHDDIAKAKPTWSPLLNSKYQPRPEILMCLGLEKNVKPPVATKTTPAQSLANVKLKMDDEEEVQVVLRDDGYYQIGSADSSKTPFVLSFTVGYAASLENLVSDTIDNEVRSFFFYYTLLGNDIVTDKFQDIHLNDFLPERASIKILSSLPNLRTYFKQTNGIKVLLCGDERPLGSATVFVDNFIKSDSKISDLPVKIEDCFELLTSRHSQVESFSEDMKPVVGISIILRLETDIVSEVKRVEPTMLNSSVEIERGMKKFGTLSPPEKLKKSPKKGPSPHKISEIPLHSSPFKPKRLQQVTEKKPEFTPVPSLSKQENKFNHYEFTIDMKSVKNVSHRLLYIIARFSWSYFGNVAPISTDPPVQVNPDEDEEVNLPANDIMVSFATLPAQLRDIFTRQSIPVEIVQGSEVIGQGAIALSHLISGDSIPVVNDNGELVERWFHSQTVVIDEANKSGKRLCELRVALMLDNLGAMKPKEEDLVTPQQPTTERYLRRNAEVDPEMAEKVALELEQWKEMQENIFKKKLQEKERSQMEGLANAWSRKEVERETLFKRRLDEYKELEEKLKVGLESVEKKERQLQTKEDEMERLKVDLQSEYDRLVQEVRDISRRVKEECAHKNELERSKAKALQDQCVKLQRQVTELEKKLEIKDVEFASFKDHRERPEIRLQSQINVLNMEKAELERRNEALQKSKNHYKFQYGKCLKELARIKQAMQMEAHAQLRERKKELNLMKIGLERKAQNLLNEENERRIVSNTSEPTTSGPSEMPAAVSQSLVNLLLAERERLLDSGNYTNEDPVIVQLDKEIYNASANIHASQ